MAEENKEKEQQDEKLAEASLNAGKIRQMTETDGWQMVEAWIKTQISNLYNQSMNPGHEDFNSYIRARGQYEGLSSVLLVVADTINAPKRLTKQEEESK